MNMLNNTTHPTSFKTIEEIEIRKAMLLADIQKDDSKLRTQWHSLFERPAAAFNKSATPSKRINSIMSTGAGLLDAFILGWKLYIKFKK